jgi:thioesterase domain-containing protein
LAGWSFGGVLAYEMAYQLESAGASVRFLGLFDANPVLDPITGLPMAQTPFLGLLDDVVARLDDPGTTDADLRELTSSQTWVQLMGAPIAAGASSTYLRTVLDTARACMNAAMAYRPPRYGGPVHLFQAADAGAQRQDQLAAVMRELCTGPLTVVRVPGDHWGFIRSEHAAEAAKELDVALERIGETGSPNHGY